MHSDPVDRLTRRESLQQLGIRGLTIGSAGALLAEPSLSAALAGTGPDRSGNALRRTKSEQSLIVLWLDGGFWRSAAV